MGLESTLFTGLSGLDVNQTRLNVVGNNIANVNTTGFKSSRALFKTQFYVTDDAGAPANATFGGSNPSQRGLGVSVGAIEKDFDPGSLEETGKDTDLAVDGDGFFIVQGNGAQKYTRDGSFTLNASNQLVTSGGDFVQGYGVDANNNIIPSTLKNITIPVGSLTTAQATSNATLTGNLNAGGVVAQNTAVYDTDQFTLAGGAGTPTGGDALINLVNASDGTSPFAAGQTLTVNGKKGADGTAVSATLTVNNTTTLDDLTSFIQNGLGIDPNVPTTTAGAPGVSLVTTGSNINLHIISNTGSDNYLTLDNQLIDASTGGGSPTTPFTVTQDTTDPGTASTAVGEGESTAATAVVYDSLGTAVNLNVTTVFEGNTPAGNQWRFYVSSPQNVGGDSVIGNGTLTFDDNGRLTGSTGTTININRTGTGATSPLGIKLDFGQVTSLTSTSSDLKVSDQDGLAFGSLSTFAIGQDGVITGSFTNNQQRVLGQVALATFNDPQGLVDQGSNEYTAGASSGLAIVSAPGQLGSGLIQAGKLEQSNVDLSTEFTNLIIATTGFSAASRVITTSDQLITDLLNSSR
jgi:flagellar hook protein FlgE